MRVLPICDVLVEMAYSITFFKQIILCQINQYFESFFNVFIYMAPPLIKWISKQSKSLFITFYLKLCLLVNSCFW